jgi:HSP20 family protein
MALFTRVIKNNNQEDESLNKEEQESLTDDILTEPVVETVAAPILSEPDREWLDCGTTEGQLAVDVYQTDESIIIKSTIAGAKPEDIDVAIDNDMVTIRGARHQEEEIKEENFFYQECYWGDFSRSIVLPVEIKAEEAEAILKNGVLTLILPKEHKSKSFAVKVKGE